jgi:pyruvate,water dikinase
MSEQYVLDLGEISKTQVELAGGKGAQLGELSRLSGVQVPAGFCVTTDAFRRVLSAGPGIDDQLERLSRLDPGDREAIGALSAEIRRTVQDIAIPGDLAEAITRSVTRLGRQTACAVRSSATAEDLPTASFAGQQDTYLNVAGPAAILEHVSRCWASLFTERAVTYRLRNGFGRREVRMAVVVQRMIFPQAAGILFTADPVTSNRRVVSIEATFGLGEALVSGLVNPDVYQVQEGEVVARTITAKRVALQPRAGGGMRELPVEPERQGQPALTDTQAVALAQLGRRIEAHFGQPQDIEWCLADDGFHVVQSRPITTLFPVPVPVAGDQGHRVYISVGHQQMMTDPMRPLGLSLWQATTPRPMGEAGGRLFVDVTEALGSRVNGAGFLAAMGRSDPLTEDALRTILARGDFVPVVDDEPAGAKVTSPAPRTPSPGTPSPRTPSPRAPSPRTPSPEPHPGSGPIPVTTTAAETYPAVVAELIERCQASITRLRADIQAVSGPELVDFILADVKDLQRYLFDPRSRQMIMAGMEASAWLNERMLAWLGEKNAADALTQSVPGNVTSAMGLALLDVADVIRPHPGVVEFLRRTEDAGFLEQLPGLDGGTEARDAIQAYLDSYGMRCVGEIDVTTPRWSERPAALVPMILGNVQNCEPGAGRRRFERGQQEARRKEAELLARLRQLPDGEAKASQARRMIDRVRSTLTGYREYPKYHMVSRYFVYKQALLGEAGRLVRAQVLREQDDIFYLRLPELRQVLATSRADDQLIRQRREEFRAQQSLTPPRVITSDGEVITGTYQRSGAPAGALPGLAVSAGTVEGRARVILDMAETHFEAGDILVTAFTDPSWTPAFVAISGLVTEVGGLMTHGAVIAREYGLPAVVGVEQATRLIRDGQRIRVNGADGYVEILA